MEYSLSNTPQVVYRSPNSSQQCWRDLSSTRRIANSIAAVIKDISNAGRGLHLIPYAIAFAVIYPIRGTKVIGTVVKVIRAVNEVIGTIVKVIGAVLKVVD